MIRASLALLSFFVFSSVNAQCTKDTDCRDPRICEKGVCTYPQTPKTEPAPFGAPASKGAEKSSATELSRLIESEVSCAKDPEPSAVVSKLQQAGLLAKRFYLNTDSVSYFAVTGHLTAFGLPVLAVFGFDDDRRVFERGPGTAPNIHLGVIFQSATGDQLTSVIRRTAANAPLPRLADLADDHAKALRNKGPFHEVACEAKVQTAAAPSPKPAQERSGASEPAALDISWRFDQELFPSFLLATSVAKPPSNRAPNFIGDYWGSVGVSVVSPRPNAQARLVVNIDNVAEPTVFEATLAEQGQKYFLSPNIRYRSRVFPRSSSRFQ